MEISRKCEMKYKQPDEVMIILDEGEVRLISHILTMVRANQVPNIGRGRQDMLANLSVEFSDIQFPENDCGCHSCSNYEDADY